MGPTVSFNLVRPDGLWFGYREVEKLASLSGIQLRVRLEKVITSYMLSSCPLQCCVFYVWVCNSFLLNWKDEFDISHDLYPILTGTKTFVRHFSWKSFLRYFSIYLFTLRRTLMLKICLMEFLC